MKNHQVGFSLIELMISLLLGLSLIAGISELFLQSQKTYKAQRSLSYMMEDGRYALEILSKELRHTGFLRNRNAKDGLPGQVFLADTVALGTSISPTIDLNGAESIHGEQGDAFVFRYQLNDKNDLSASDPSNSSSPCSQDIDLEDGEDPAIEAHVVTTHFFVDAAGVLYCEAKRETIDFANQLLVYMKPSSQKKLPIISNVERLVVKYGVDFDTDTNPNLVDTTTGNTIPNPRFGLPRVQLDPADTTGGTVLPDANGNPIPVLDRSANYYVDADNVGDWTRVVSAKLYVVMRSEDDELTQGNATYTIEDATYTATDKRYYRVFSTTIAFRNQI